MKLKPSDTIIILSHYYKHADQGGGPPQDLRDYLLPKVKRLVYIEHPFPYADDHHSYLTLYQNGKVKQVLKSWPKTGPLPFFYFMDLLITFYFLIRVGFRYTYCLALDNFNSFIMLPYRRLKWVSSLIFYTIDYTPVRFTNPLLNRLYHFIDRIACYGVDTIWILSERMVKARTRNGVNIDRSAPSVILPMGAKLSRIRPLPLSKINRSQLIFVGHLLEKQGLQLVIEALPAVIAKVPETKLVVIGQGEYEPKLKELVRTLKLDRYVIFKGFIKTHEEVEKILCQSAIGLAPYLPDLTNFTYYTDPGKPKLYLGCGLPVVITDVPASATTMAKHKAAIIVRYTHSSIADALLTLLMDHETYKRYRANALKLSKEYDTDRLIERALRQT